MKTHDFRVCTWGHNLSVRPIAGGYYRGFVWSTPGPKVGDTVLWETNYGHAEATLTHVEWTGNVDDMYKIEAEVTRRVANPDIVSQAEIDEYFGQES